MSAPPASPPKVPLFLLALFVLSGTPAMHIFVPGAVPTPRPTSSASIVEMQMTVSLYIFGLALGQLSTARSSDRFGRRPVLMEASCSPRPRALPLPWRPRPMR